MATMLWWLMAVGCVEQWCGRFNLQCDGTSIAVPEVVDVDLDGWASDDDCDDNNPTVFPSAIEQCNNIDENCDGVVDEGMPPMTNWFWDGDDDGFGGTTYTGGCIEQPDGFAATSDDCDDSSASIHPDATEICNLRDDDCDGLIDGEDTIDDEHLVTWFIDADGDGAAADGAKSFRQCTPPDDQDYATLEGDCDDSDPTIGPGIAEVCEDGIDQDCDGVDAWGICDAWSASSADATLVGVLADDRAGTAVDIMHPRGPNPLLVIGAPGPGFRDGGTVYVGPAAVSGEVALTDFGVMWWGPEESQAGVAIAALANYGTAGMTALLVGAPARQGDEGITGAVYLLMDPTADGGAIEDSAVEIVGDQVGRRLGQVIGVGDTDGDGLRDAVIGAASTYTRQPSLWLWSGIAPTQAEFDDSPRVWADTDTYLFGQSFVVSDFNSDGVDDLVAAGMRGSGDGLVEPMVYFEGPITSDITGPDAQWTLETTPPEAGQPMRLTVAGDHDGDGRRDLAVACRGVASYDAGVIGVFTDLETRPGTLTDAYGLIVGHDTDAPLGQLTSYLPSGTGGDADDLLFTMPSASYSAGTVLLMRGPISGTLSSNETPFSISGPTGNHSFGRSLALPLDLGSDGGLVLVAGTDPSVKSSTDPTRLSLFLLEY
jgi:Putative metal-binding motif